VTQFENSLGAEVWSPRDRIKWAAAAALAKGRNLEPRLGSLLAESDAVIALSDRHLDVLAKASPCAAGKSTVIPAPPLLRIRSDGQVARAEGRRHLGLAPDDDETVVLTYFGYVYPGKGVETLLKAIVLLKQRNSKLPAFKLVIIGDITDHNLAEELKALEQNLEPGDSPLWLGNKEGEEASTFLWATDIALLPFDEGIRLNNSSFAVCATHGLPVITTEGQQLEPAFKQMENVLLCPPKDAGALASAIEQLLTSPALRARLGAGAAMLSKNVFSWETNTNATMKVLKSVQDSRVRVGAKPKPQ
jgi:glycosyltransferase involved in cell wall biosynthesis